MTTNRICYRPLPKYKYQLSEDYSARIRAPQDDIVTPFVVLAKSGDLTVKKNYAWDGPSGPTVDTRNFMRGALEHDALYQLMRLGLLDAQEWRSFADDRLRDVCIEDGMSRFRAFYVHKAVRWFAASHARPRPDEAKVVCAPK